jgi:hypothetical protein
MQNVIFKYKKKKDDQEKRYTILLLDLSIENHPNNFGGIDLTKLSDSEVEDILMLQYEYESRNRMIQNNSLKEDLTFNNILDREDYKELKENYKSKMSKYVKKAYRVFIRQNVIGIIENIDNGGLCNCYIKKTVDSKNKCI